MLIKLTPDRKVNKGKISFELEIIFPQFCKWFSRHFQQMSHDFLKYFEKMKRLKKKKYFLDGDVVLSKTWRHLFVSKAAFLNPKHTFCYDNLKHFFYVKFSKLPYSKLSTISILRFLGRKWKAILFGSLFIPVFSSSFLHKDF